MAAYLVHRSAEQGFKNAQAYDSHRPSYPTEAVDKLLRYTGLGGHVGARIVDLAAGTGKLTESLAARDEGYDIVAVEPLESMRDTLAAKELRGVTVRNGTAANMDTVEDGWADVVVVAQAFHWFANDEALAEIYRVLKPGGGLALIWNGDDYNRPRRWEAHTKWEQQLYELMLSIPSDGQSRFRDDAWGDVFDRQLQSATPLFRTPLQEDKTSWSLWRTKEGLWDRLRTLGPLAMLEGAALRAFRARFEELMERAEDATWNEKGEVLLHGVTFSTWTTRA